MKKFLIFIMIMVLSAGAANAIIDSYTIKRDQLPEAAREMLDQYFPKAKISMIKIDRHLLKKTDYDVKLTDGTKIDFNNKGKWTSVDCGKKKVPESLVPKTIRNYVSKHYNDAKVTSILRRISGGYDIGISSGKYLRFNALYIFKSEITKEDVAADIKANLEASEE